MDEPSDGDCHGGDRSYRSQGLNPEEQILAKERAVLVRKFFRRLKPEDMELIESWNLDEKKVLKQLALRLGISDNALRIRVHRIRHRAKELFEQGGLSPET